MEDFNKEKYINDSPLPVSIKGTEIILDQMKTCICKILKDNAVKGTGFFCKIPYENNLLPVLITNNHVLNSKDINVTNNITISLNDNKEFKHIEIDNSRKLFTNEELDVTIIEIKANKDKINEFLEIDELVYKNDEYLKDIFASSSLYTLNYPEGSNVVVSYGLLSQLNGKDINHLCNTKEGSSGAPILSLKSHKVIGIHIGSYKSKFKNKGVFIKYPLAEFNKKNYNNNIIKTDTKSDYLQFIKNIKKLYENEMLYEYQLNERN